MILGYNKALAGENYHKRTKGLSSDGNNIDIEVTMYPIYDDKGSIVGVSCRRQNISEYVRLITTLKDHNEQLRQIAWMQSHKLRGPLSTLMGISMVLSRMEVSLDEKKQLIISASEKLNEIDQMIKEIVAMTNKYNNTLKDE
jgi:K+-sensing histidine kinase KdpD